MIPAEPACTFRVTEDLSLADQGDECIEIDFGAQAKGRICLVHPMNPPAGGFESWGSLFADYEISQPFAQLGRERFALTEDEKSSNAIRRFEGIKVESGRLREILAYGWRLGQPEFGGDICWVEKPLQFRGQVMVAVLQFARGYINAAGVGDESPVIGALTLMLADRGNIPLTSTLGDLDPVTASEILRGPALVLSKAVS